MGVGHEQVLDEVALLALRPLNAAAAAALAIAAAAQAVDDARLKLAEVPTIYPAGGEKQLVELLTGEEVPSGRYPSEFGYVCQNVGTAFAVQRLRADTITEPDQREQFLAIAPATENGLYLVPKVID